MVEKIRRYRWVVNQILGFVLVEARRDCHYVQYGPYNPSTTITWSSSNTPVATVSGGWETGIAPGSATILARWDAVVGVNYTCAAIYANVGAGATCNVRPTISGPNEMWWFHGANPPGFATQISLSTQNTGNSYNWVAVTGGSKVILSNENTDTVTITSDGMSDNPNDVGIQVSVDGQVSNQLNITIRAPHSLSLIETTHSSNATWGYETRIRYSIRNQFTALLPGQPVPINEQWSTAVVDDFPGNNWFQAPQFSNTLPIPVLEDFITGQRSSQTPTATAPQSPELGSTRVHHWGQDTFVGSLTIGAGRRVQSNTHQKYTDHAAHENIVSPNPN